MSSYNVASLIITTPNNSHDCEVIFHFLKKLL